jgi:hypothetical protein
MRTSEHHQLSHIGFRLRRDFDNCLLLGGAKDLPYREDVEVFEDLDDLVVPEFEQPVIGLFVVATGLQRHLPVGDDRNTIVLGGNFAIVQLARPGLGIEDRRQKRQKRSLIMGPRKG